MMETRIGATQDPALGLSAPAVMDPVLFMSSDVCAVIQCLHTRDCGEVSWDPGRSKVFVVVRV
jgi:hypothetical protein